MGDEASGLVGVWILRSAYGERFDTKERTFLFGENPRGVLMLHESGRMAALITPSLQRDDPPPTPRQLVAYSGRYRIEPPSRFVTDVDIAWFPTWVGSAQGRNFSLRGRRAPHCHRPSASRILRRRGWGRRSQMGA